MTYQVASAPLKTIFGEFEFYCFSWGGHEDDNVLSLRVPDKNPLPLVRLQSACFTAEIFRSTDCDCHEQLESSLRTIQEQGGLLIYLLQDGRGAGIYLKAKALRLGSTHGLDTAEAYAQLGIPPDPRTYERAVAVLRYFDIGKVRLLTNNPRKVAGLEAGGIEVERVPLEIPATLDSFPYLLTKKTKMGHMLRLDEKASTERRSKPSDQSNGGIG